MQSASCPDGALNKPQAVVTAGSNTFCYDPNGNMVKRNSGAYTLSYDAENRLTGVSGGATAAFVYGPGSERVKGTVGGTTTLYINNYYEKQGTTVRKYYYAGGTRVAMRESGTLYWLLSDHLGSQAVTAYDTGGLKAQVRYRAFGEDRYGTGTTPTTYRFTGQRQESSIGLYYYGARWYDPALARFVQADTVQPNLGDPQQLNRFSYARDNPVRYADPTGHYIDEGSGTEDASTAYAFYSPSDAQSAWDTGTAQRVSLATCARNGSQPSDLDVIVAMTSPLWAGMAIAAAPDFLATKAGQATGQAALGDFLGQLLTTGDWDPTQTLAAGLVGLAGSPITPKTGGGAFAKGAISSFAQYGLGTLLSGEQFDPGTAGISAFSGGFMSGIAQSASNSLKSPLPVEGIRTFSMELYGGMIPTILEPEP